jgi:hypothetical protein
MNNLHVGSSFDEFLEEEGLFAEVEATAIQRVIAYQLQQVSGTNIVMVKAFLYSLSQQKAPLPEEIETQIGNIFIALKTRCQELLDLALAIPSLKIPYENAELWFDLTIAERKGGLKFLPVDDPHDDGMGESVNVTDDPAKAIAEMEKILEIIDRDYEDAAKTLSQPNPIQNLQQFIQNKLNR